MENRMFDLHGMTALVTGASGGIGSAIARSLAAQGARLAVSGSNAAKLRAFRDELDEHTPQHLQEVDHVAITCDLSDPEAVEKLVPAAVDSLGKIDIGKVVAKVASDRFEARTGRSKKLIGVQLGYESRCAAPHAFDVMLGCQLGVGAYRCIVDRGLDGHMVSVAGQLDLRFVPFTELVDPKTLKTEVRFIELGSDFHRLAREVETRLPKKPT